MIVEEKLDRCLSRFQSCHLKLYDVNMKHIIIDVKRNITFT